MEIALKISNEIFRPISIDPQRPPLNIVTTSAKHLLKDLPKLVPGFKKYSNQFLAGN